MVLQLQLLDWGIGDAEALLRWWQQHGLVHDIIKRILLRFAARFQVPTVFVFGEPVLRTLHPADSMPWHFAQQCPPRR